MKNLYVGIDPAKVGAATVIDEEKVTVAVVLWRQRSKNKVKYTEVQVYDYEENKIKKHSISDPIFVGKIICDYLISKNATINLACEDCFVRLNPKVAINLARLSGQLISPIEYEFEIKSLFVKANDWRKTVIGSNIFTERSKVKKQSLQFIPFVLPCISKALKVFGQLDHITDSAGIALWLHNSLTGKQK